MQILDHAVDLMKKATTGLLYFEVAIAEGDSIKILVRDSYTDAKALIAASAAGVRPGES